MRPGKGRRVDFPPGLQFDYHDFARTGGTRGTLAPFLTGQQHQRQQHTQNGPRQGSRVAHEKAPRHPADVRHGKLRGSPGSRFSSGRGQCSKRRNNEKAHYPGGSRKNSGLFPTPEAHGSAIPDRCALFSSRSVPQKKDDTESPRAIFSLPVCLFHEIDHGVSKKTASSSRPDATPRANISLSRALGPLVSPPRIPPASSTVLAPPS